MTPSVPPPIRRLARAVRSRQTPLLIAVVVLAAASAITYVQFAVKRIESGLPLQVMDEKLAMEQAARNFYRLLSATESALVTSSSDGVPQIREHLGTVAADLQMLRDHYTFDTLIGASALHALLSPVLDDVQIWLTEGISGVPPSSPMVLDLVANRARHVLGRVYEKTAEADRMAYAILEQQSAELRQLRARLVAVLAALGLLAASFVWVAIRQQRARRGQEQAEAERIRAQSRLRDALESTSEGFAFFGADDRLLTCNSRYREFYLRGVRDLVEPGTSYRDIVRAIARRGLVTDAAEDPEGWTARRLERFRRPEGPFVQALADGRWVQVNERKTADGGTVAVHSDISALKHRELDLLHAKEGAEAANQAKSAFLANVSHELRTPLTSILGFARIVRKRLDDHVLPWVRLDDARTNRAMRQIRENLEIIHVEGERLTTLVNNVLDLEKIEAGEMVWNVASLDIEQLLGQAAAATRNLYESKGLGFSVGTTPGLPLALGDRDRVLQVLINLISNAVKFTDRGRVECHARLQPPDRISISVSDTGRGLSPEEQRVVFEKFRQVGDTLTDKPAGTGLGLSICKEIVELLDGEISVSSTPGRGSTFCFTLPVAQAAGSTGTSPAWNTG